MTERDPSIGADGLTRRDRDLIRDVLARYPEVRRVTLFGSRAMGTFGRGSDIDLALEGPDLDARTLTRIATELEDSDLPYKVDLLLRDDQLEPKLEAHIRRHGKPFGWEETTLSDVSTDIAYGYTQSADSEKVGPHFLRITDIQNGTVDWSTVPYCPINASDYAKYKLKSGDIVVARTGNSTGENYIFRANEDVVFASYLIRFRIDPAQADSLFVWYWMRTPAWWSFVNNSKTGSAQAGANAKILGSYQFTLPPIDEQRAIAAVLGALDDKIEQNRRTAQALERLARAIFRAWFVDFEPVKAKAAGATTFPSMPQPVFDALPTTFTDFPIGPVPEGWTVGVIKDLAALSKTQIKPQETQTAIFDHFSIPAFDAGMRAVVESGSAIKSNKFLVVEGCILLSKLNPRIPRVWLPPPPCGRQQIASTEFLVFVPRSPFDRHYLYCQFKQSAFCEGLAQDASGTSNSHQRVRPDDLLGKEVILSPTTVRMGFGGIADALFALAATNHCESSTLANLRDYLIPKLLSGDVRVWTQASVQVFRGAV